MKASRSPIFFFFFLLLFLLNTFCVFQTDFAGKVDRWVYDLFVLFDNTAWIRISQIITFFGNGSTLYVLGGIVIGWLLMGRRVKAAVLYFSFLAVGFSLNALLKLYFARPRPIGYDVSHSLTTYAYPSGHAFDSLIFYFMTLLVLSQSWPVAVKRSVALFFSFLVLAIGLSRITLGVHWLSDVTGGWFLGAAWIFLSQKKDK